MYDLLKNFTNPYKILDSSRLIGWQDLLKSLAILNVRLSAVQSSHAKQLITGYKSNTTPVQNVDEYSFSDTPVSHVRKKVKVRKDRDLLTMILVDG